MRDVPNGWFLRYVHANGASMFFIVVYSHIFRGLYYGSYMTPRKLLWCSGVILFILMMATAFTGYVLPWGQMSFWGATVITSMFTIIPIAGRAIVEWLWGGFTIKNPTLNRIFSLHFILPFLIAGVTLIHLALLHKDGSNNPIGSDVGIDDVPFYPCFVSKDMFAFVCFLLFYCVFVFDFPNVLNHPDNCIPADPMETPAHVVPEWYFWPFYAILRSIPHKTGGIITMGGAIAVLFLILFNNTSYIRNTTYRPIFKVCYWILLAFGVVLTWLGQCPVMDFFNFVGRLITVYYYSFFIIFVPIVGRIEFVLMNYPVEEPVRIHLAILIGILIIITIFLLVFTTPILTIIWLCLPTLYCIYKRNYNSILMIWISTISLWYTLFAFSFSEFETIVVGKENTYALIHYLLINDVMNENLCFQTIFLLDQLGCIILIPNIFYYFLG